MAGTPPLLRGSLLLLTLLGVGLLLRVTPLGQLVDQELVDELVRDQGAGGVALFLVAGALGTSVGLPRQVVAWMGGYAFGAWAGAGLAICAALGGCVITLTWARFLGRDFVRRRFSKEIHRVDSFLGRNTFTTALMIRFLPAGSNFLTNLAAGVSSVRPAPFLLGSGLGYVPQSLVFALLGSGLKLGRAPQVGLSLLLFVVAAVLGSHLVRIYRRGGDVVDAESLS